MNEPAELTEGQKEALRMLQFERKLWAAEIKADCKELSLDKLVKLAEEAVSITTIGQPLFTYFYDENKSCEYFSVKDQFYCKYYKNEEERRNQQGKELKLQPKTFVDWNLSKFSAHELLRSLYTVVFGKEDMPGYLRSCAYSALGISRKPKNENPLHESIQKCVKIYQDLNPRPRKNWAGNDVAPIESETFF